MNKVLKILLLISILISCAKEISLIEGEPHQDFIQSSMGIFESDKVLISAIVDSPYFESISKCALQKDGRDCNPSIVPLLGMRNLKLNPSYILQNTIVSHSFLAKNFKEYLESLDNKFLITLFGSVSGIVITDEISSSFYYSVTGMIYINANYLWKTQNEFSELAILKDNRNSINEKKKIFSGMDFIKDNKLSYASTRKKERTIADLSYEITRLLFHELTHANDYHPVESFEELDKTKSYHELKQAKFESYGLISHSIDYPESNKTWEYSLFVNSNKLVSPYSYKFNKDDFLSFFVPDTGVDFYSYISNQEHLAMMMEAYFMMFTEGFESCHYGAHKEDNDSKYEYFWFQKNRILQKNILNTAKEAIYLLFPIDFITELNALDTNFSLQTISNISKTRRELFEDHCRTE